MSLSAIYSIFLIVYNVTLFNTSAITYVLLEAINPQCYQDLDFTVTFCIAFLAIYKDNSNFRG